MEPHEQLQSPPTPVLQTASVTTDAESAAVATVKAMWERQQVWDLLYTFRHSFAVTPNDVDRTHLVQHTIDTGNARPIRQRHRQMPYAHQATADDLIEQLASTDTIEPSDSAWASPIVMVLKKDGTCRFWADYRQLNNKTVPLRRIDECLDYVASSA